jgi:peroxiredoxin
MSFNPIAEGATAPNVVIKARVRDDTLGGDNPFTWKDVNTSELFVGKRVVLFALPGGILTALFVELSNRH